MVLFYEPQSQLEGFFYRARAEKNLVLSSELLPGAKCGSIQKQPIN